MSEPTVRAPSAFAWFTKLTPILLMLLGAVLGFVAQSVRADSTSETEIREIKAQVEVLQKQQKNEFVTKEQFSEVIKRLDEKTDRIENGVNRLLEQQYARRK